MTRSSTVVNANLSGVPRLPPAHLPRSRLLEQLQTQDYRLRLLCAPAGFGKSVLIGEFVRQLPPRCRVVWLSLAGQPLDGEQLLQRLADALELPVPTLPVDQALVQLLGRQPLWLVLDDYPHNPPPKLDACIDRLLAQPAIALQLLVSARQRPNWNLPRLLLGGELLELDTAQLAFDRAELEWMVGLLQPTAGPEQCHELWQETEGWCAGVRLLLCGDAAQAGIASGGQWLQEYLEHELLGRLSAEEAERLCALAHLPKVSVELCRHLWEEEDGAQVFQSLLQRQAFFLPLDEQGVWFRLLPAVARLLRGRLGVATETQLHLRACRFFSAHGQVEDAIEQALCAGQPEVAANYLERLSEEWLTGERHLAHLLAWRARLPALLLESTPRLLCLNAWALLLSWQLDQAEACIDKLARFLPQPSALRNRKLLANCQALRGTLAALRCNNGAAEARRHCQAALEHLPDSHWMPRLLCYSTLTRLAMATSAVQSVPDLLRPALELARRKGSLLFEALLNLDRIRLLLLRGELPRAQSLIEQSQALLARRKTTDSLVLGRLNLLQAELYLLQGRYAEAEQNADLGLQQCRDCADPFALHGYLGLADLSSRRGEFDQAFLQLREAERQMHCAQVWRLCYRGVQLMQSMRVLARQGRWERVMPIAERIERHFSGAQPWMAPLDYPALPLRNRLLRARALLHACGQAEQAHALLQALAEDCQLLQFQPLACEVALALAETGRRLGRSDALAGEREARQQAQQLGLHGLLTDWPDSHEPATDTASLREGTPAESTGLLSQREQAVLQLLAEGFSNQEIGSYLFISVNTVKTHTKKINSKLGVRRRTQAVMRAKTLGLLV
jgi:ATP/maltotriose-dependent transcriptional regulator MalT